LDVIHPTQACLPLKEIKAKISTQYGCPVDQVSLFHFRTRFGGGRSTGMCLLYDTKDIKMKYEPKHRLIRDGLLKKTVTLARKAKKTLKTKIKKLRGKAKTTAKKGK